MLTGTNETTGWGIWNVNTIAHLERRGPRGLPVPLKRDARNPHFSFFVIWYTVIPNSTKNNVDFPTKNQAQFSHARKGGTHQPLFPSFLTGAEASAGPPPPVLHTDTLNSTALVFSPPPPPPGKKMENENTSAWLKSRIKKIKLVKTQVSQNVFSPDHQRAPTKIAACLLTENKINQSRNKTN